MLRDMMVVFGGLRSGTKSNDVNCLNTKTFVWTKVGFGIARKPSHRIGHFATRTTGNKILVFGGLGWGDVALNSLEELTITDSDHGKVGSWRKLNMQSLSRANRKGAWSSPLAGVQGGLVGGRLVLYGGYQIQVNPFRRGGLFQQRVWSNDVMIIRTGPASIPVPVSCFHLDLHDLWESKCLADTLVICSDGELLAHRAILGLRSPVLASILLADPPAGSMPGTFMYTVDETGFSVSVVEAVLQFLYTHECHVDMHDIPAAFSLCSKYGIETSELGSTLLSSPRTSIDIRVPHGKVARPIVSDFMKGLPLFRPTGERPVDELCDVTIRVGDDKLMAHKAILAARSRYFKAALTSGFSESASSVLTMSDEGLDRGVLVGLLEFLYTDKLTRVSLDDAPPLLQLAAHHMIPRLAGLCEKIILNGFDFDDAESTLAILSFATSVGPSASRLRDFAMYHLVVTASAHAVETALRSLNDEIEPEIAAAVRKGIQTQCWWN